MPKEKLMQLFALALQGDTAAHQELSDYLSPRWAKAAAGDRYARDELESLVYDFTHAWVKARMKARYPYLVERHSVASVVNQAWQRLLKNQREGQAEEEVVRDLMGLFRRVAKLTHYAFLDLLAAQRRYDDVHHGRNERGQLGADRSDINLSQTQDPSAPNPVHLAQLSEFAERVETLPDDVLQVFRLHHPIVGMSFQSIAEYLGISERQVRKLWLDGLNRLEDVLPDDF